MTQYENGNNHYDAHRQKQNISNKIQRAINAMEIA